MNRGVAVWVSAALLPLVVSTPMEVLAQGDALDLDPYELYSYSLRPGIFWSDLGFSMVYDTNIELNQAEIAGPGLLADARAQLRTSTSRPLLRVEYWGRVRQYKASEKWTRHSHSVLGVLEQRFGPLGIEAIGSWQINTQTEDRETADVYLVSPRVSIRMGDARLRGFGRLWTREFDQDLGTETITTVGGEFRWRAFDRLMWEVGFRQDDGESDRPSGRFIRRSVSAEWHTDLTQRTTLIVEAERRNRTYSQRRIEVDGVEVPTEDTRWLPSVYIRHGRFPGPELQIGYEYQNRTSNDFRRGYEAHRAMVSVRSPFLGWVPQTGS